MQAEAERERAIFAQLNAAEAQTKSSRGNSDAFMSPYDRSNPSPAEAKPAPKTGPQ